MIHIQNITFGYRRKPKLFNDLSLNLGFGNIYGLFGVNGAGKTTLLKQIGGLLKPTMGEITINNFNVAGRSAEALANVFLVPEEFALPSIKTSCFVQMNAPFYTNFNHQLFETSMREFEMYGDENLAAMSYGQKKKFLISFGLATQTPLLLLDEPTNGLDIPSKSQFRKIMAQVATDDRCFVISTHQVRDLASMIDHAVMVDKGRIVFNQSMMDISKNLTFKHITGEMPAGVVYSEDTVSGKNIIGKAMGDESEVDLEILFNGVVKNAQSINEAFKTL